MKMVVYEGNGEVIVCRKSDEENIVKEYFTDSCRVLDEYDRRVVAPGCVIMIRLSMRVCVS